MSCKTVKTRIALWAGNDLDPAGKREVKEHVAACEPCREYWREMKTSMHALKAPANAADEHVHASLWPRISSRLPKRVRKPRQNHFNGWAAAASVAAACLVLVTYAVTYPYQSRHGAVDYAVPSSIVFGSPVEYSPDRPAPKSDANRSLEEKLFGPRDKDKSRNTDDEFNFPFGHR